MIRFFILNVVPGILYLIIYAIFRSLLSTSEVISFILTLVFILTLHSRIVNSLKNLRYTNKTRKYLNIDAALSEFEDRLDSISHYHELITEIYNLFNILFPEKTWLFYVFDKESYQRIEYDTSKWEEDLPEDIEFNNNIDKQKLITLGDIDRKSIKDIGFDPQNFLQYDIDTLIPVKGKSQLIALLFTSHSNLFFLDEPEIRGRAENILQKTAQILESTVLHLDLIQRNLEIKKLFEVSNKLLTSLNTGEILDFLLDALTKVVQFDAGVIFLFDPETKKLFRKVSRGYKDGLDLTLKLGQGACGWVAETREISLIKDTRLADHYYPIRPETHSQISLPLERQSELMGVLSLESDKIGYFTTHSIELLKLFANQAIIALHNAKQYEISITKKHLEHELVHAGKVQQVLLPQRPPHLHKLNISFEHIASKLVSGDLFDLAAINEYTLGLVVGDVSGKGAGAAIMMSLVLAGFRAYQKSKLAVCEVVARLNNLLEESVSDGRFATLFYAIISTQDNKITYTNAGHNPPYLFRTNGEYEELTGGGIVLGFLANQIYKQKTIPFTSGDLLINYTDGITEALNISGEEFGEKRLINVIQNNLHLSSYDLKNLILTEVNQFTQSSEISDDQTLVIVKYE